MKRHVIAAVVLFVPTLIACILLQWSSPPIQILTLIAVIVVSVIVAILVELSKVIKISEDTPPSPN